MKPDWSRVTLKHIQRACEKYDSGAAQPNRPARSTFLLLNGKTYPAKFIRGLAYNLATGIELDPNRDFSGGAETIKYFDGLGLATRHDSTSDQEEPTKPSIPLPPAQETPNPPQQHREPQKRALAELLSRRFGPIEVEAEFPWLNVPALDEMDEALGTIFKALEKMRGFSKFVTPGKLLRCDFFVPSKNLVIEYDEKQHFTVQRATALELYPPDTQLGFDREEWLNACRTIKATDPTPPYRDEQRAFYDSLRDILAARNGVRLIRLRYGTFDWTGAGAEEQLATLFATGQLPGEMPSAVVAAQEATKPPLNRIMKIALISHDYNLTDSKGLYDYSEHFHRINKVCDEQGCDTILYALYTWDRDSTVEKSHDTIFGTLAHVQRVILEVGQPALESFDHVEIWLRGQNSPVVVKQRFATSTSPGSSKQAFLDDLKQRQIADALLVLCGETNIASVVRGSDEFFDPYNFNDRLGEMKVRLILNPIHDYMRRYEMKEKRRYYSLGGRTVISVWNQGKGKESHFPWTILQNGEDKTKVVQELPKPFPDRPDIRIGIVDLSSL